MASNMAKASVMVKYILIVIYAMNIGIGLCIFRPPTLHKALYTRSHIPSDTSTVPGIVYAQQDSSFPSSTADTATIAKFTRQSSDSIPVYKIIVSKSTVSKPLPTSADGAFEGTPISKDQTMTVLTKTVWKTVITTKVVMKTVRVTEAVTPGKPFRTNATALVKNGFKSTPTETEKSSRQWTTLSTSYIETLFIQQTQTATIMNGNNDSTLPVGAVDQFDKTGLTIVKTMTIQHGDYSRSQEQQNAVGARSTALTWTVGMVLGTTVFFLFM